MYRAGSHDVTYLFPEDKTEEYIELKNIFDLLKTNESKLKFDANGTLYDYFPTRNFKITVDKNAVLSSGTLPLSMADSMADTIRFSIKGQVIMKNQLVVLDLLATNNWQRPIYFSFTAGNESYLGLDDYLQLEGFAYRLVPMKKVSPDDYTGNVNTAILYNNYMKKFTWGGIDNPKVYLDETSRRNISNFRSNFGRLAQALMKENKVDSAVVVSDYCLKVFPDESVHFDYTLLNLIGVYYQAGANEKGDRLSNRLIELYAQNLVYYFSFPKEKAFQTDEHRRRALGVMQFINLEAEKYGRVVVATQAKKYLDQYYQKYMDAPYMQQ